MHGMLRNIIAELPKGFNLALIKAVACEAGCRMWEAGKRFKGHSVDGVLRLLGAIENGICITAWYLCGTDICVRALFH